MTPSALATPQLWHPFLRSDSAQLNIPDLRAPRGRAVGSGHLEDCHVVAGFLEGMHRILLGGRFAVAEVPFPGGYFRGTNRFILEGDETTVEIDDVEAPASFERGQERRLDRHQ